MIEPTPADGSNKCISAKAPPKLKYKSDIIFDTTLSGVGKKSKPLCKLTNLLNSSICSFFILCLFDVVYIVFNIS